jgi:DNA-binding CsgD family transcriptional regulator
VGADGYLAGVLDVVARIGRAAEFAELVELLHKTVALFGASAACFATFVREDESFGPRRLLLACDPSSLLECDRTVRLEADRWLSYAARQSRPAREVGLATSAGADQAVLRNADRSCFQSTVCIPAPADSQSGRVGALVIGSETLGFFDDDGYPAFKAGARLVAIELNDRCVELVRNELLLEVDLSDADLRLLRYARDGLTTKAIARQSGWSGLAIDTRFKRMLPKFHVHSRTDAARLAADYRII